MSSPDGSGSGAENRRSAPKALRTPGAPATAPSWIGPASSDIRLAGRHAVPPNGRLMMRRVRPVEVAPTNRAGTGAKAGLRAKRLPGAWTHEVWA